MTTWKTNVENLVRMGSLNTADYIEEDVVQYVADAAAYFRDARLVTTPQSRFLLSYEGLHVLSMAVLNKAEVRVDSGEGHRQTALQVALLISDINALQPGAATAVMQLHRTRNSKTYRSPLPPVSASQAEAAFKALDIMLAAACASLEIERPE